MYIVYKKVDDVETIIGKADNQRTAVKIITMDKVKAEDGTEYRMTEEHDEEQSV